MSDPSKKTNPNGRRTLQSAPQNVPMGARKEYHRRENDGRVEKGKERGKQPDIGETTLRIQDESLRRKNNFQQSKIKQIRETDLGQSA